MQVLTARRIARVAAIVLAATWGVAAVAPTAWAEDKAKTERTAGKFLKWDKEGGTISIKEKGKEIVFAVVAEGSVLTRTTVTVKAKPAKLDDLKEGQILVVYWKPGAGDKKDARKIDAVSLPDGVEEEEGEY
jgi:hypothetical protein